MTCFFLDGKKPARGLNYIIDISGNILNMHNEYNLNLIDKLISYSYKNYKFNNVFITKG